ncbi:ribokinase [Paraburkholderia sp. XV]|uniref:ribokinase n=1 Tax=Paraburkholderia sp. XV TaxID=2831520 RepID=UPI001CD2A687|nr:ribokinase [Paraburkholderia sp. XV]
MDSTIISIGSINADFQMRTSDNEHSETSRAERFCRLSAGKAANRAYLARRLKHDARLIGMVGDDDLAEQALGSLREHGVDLSAVMRAPGCPTAVSIIMVPSGGKKRIVLAPNANECWRPEQIGAAIRALEAAPPDSLLTMDCEIAAHVSAALLDAAVKRRLRIVLDTAPPEYSGKDEIRRLWPHIVACSPNEEEAAALTGMRVGGRHDAMRAARKLHESGFELACVKLGDGGCAAFSNEGPRIVKVPAIKPEDTTGAGDAFTGALAVALGENLRFDDALRFATASANVAVTRWGSQESYGTREEIDSLAASLTVEVPDAWDRRKRGRSW